MTDAEDFESSDSSMPPIRLEVVADATIGYASHQNDVPIIRELRIFNDSQIAISDLEIIIESDPPFADGTKLRFERLAPGESRRITPVDIRIQHGYLSKLTEMERARLKISVRAGGENKGSIEHAVDVLAYDQWAGSRALPELLAAFCMPNNPAVDSLISKASELLRRPGAGVMDGYQSHNREHVRQQISALYNVIAAEDLHYSNPPASFGTDGQKIRTPDRILDGKVATCLDLAMLLASCMEQAGLNAVVLFKKEHAWVGCWLVPTFFSTPTIEDSQAIRKRVQSGEFMVFETTVLAQKAKGSLRAASELGNRHLTEEDEFRFAVDIKRARERRILPLPSRGDHVETRIAESGTGPLPIEVMPPLPPLDADALAGVDLTETPDTPAGRLARWKRMDC